MALSDRLAIIITANGSQAVGEFNRVGRAAGSSLGQAEQRTQRLGSQLTRAGAAMVTFGAVALVGLYKLAQAAEEQTRAELQLQNTISAMPELAGASADAFTAQAEALMAVTVADDAAIVSMQAMLGTFHLTADEMTTATPLVLDYARKFGVDLVTAAKQVGKALQGNIGTLQRNGIAIDENAYATDRFGAVMDALRENAGGFAEAEGATFSGRLEIMKNQLGEVAEGVGVGVVDAFSDLLGAVDGASGAFSSLDPNVQSTVGRLATFASVGLVASGGLSLIAGSAMKMAGQAKAAADAAYMLYLRVRTSNLSLGQVAGAAAGAAAALAVVAVAYQTWKGINASAAAQESAVAGALAERGDAVDRLSQALADLPGDDATAAGEEITRAMGAAGVSMEDFATAVELGGGRLDLLVAQLQATGEVSDETRGALEQVMLDPFGSSGASTVEDVDRIRNALTLLGVELDEADANTAAEDAIAGVGSSAALSTEQLDELSAALETFFTTTFGVQRATDDVVEAQNALFESLVANGPNLLGVSEGALANRDAFDGWAVSIGTAAEALAGSSEGVAGANVYIDQQRASLLAARDAGLISSDTFRTYSGILNGIRTEVTTTVTTPGADSAIAAFQAIRENIDRIPRQIAVQLTLAAAVATATGAAAAAVGAQQWTGGEVAGTGPKPVMAHGGEYILSADVVNRIKRGRQSRGARTDSAGSSGGGGVVVNIHGDTYGVDKLTEKVMAGIRKAERRVAS